MLKQCSTYWIAKMNDHNLKISDKQLSDKVFQSLINSELDAFIIADENSNIIRWNSAAETLFGNPREHVLGKNLHQILVPEETRERAINAYNHFKGTGAGPLINSVIEMDALHRSGDIIPVSMSISAFESDGKWFSQAILRSIGRRKELESEMRRLATRDALTGAYNREIMFAHGKRELSRAMRYGSTLSVVLIDIDQLNVINERWGYYFGDQVIKTLTDFLLDNCRHSDVVGRFSSKEVLILLPETDVSMAFMVAEKWRITIKSLDVKADGALINFNCSIGVSGLSNEDQFEALLKKVESNLLQSKALGGDKVTCNDKY